nr:uncharacterized protein LOC113819319 [Penaeus vannamei]
MYLLATIGLVTSVHDVRHFLAGKRAHIYACKHIHVHLTPLAAYAKSYLDADASIMNTLTIVLVAAFAVVASGMKDGHPNDQEFHHTLHEAKKMCMDIMMPSEDEMSNMKGKMKECLEKEGHTHLTSHPALASDKKPHLKHALCFREELKGISAESRRLVSLCALEDHGVLDGEEVNVTKVMELLRTKIDAAEDSVAKEALSTALSNLSEEPLEADLLHFMELKKSLMNSCLMNVVASLTEEKLLAKCSNS